MRGKIVRIGIYQQEVFFEHENGGCDVIRPVSVEKLEKLRTVDGLIDYGYDEDWKNAVSVDVTTLGLYEYLEELLDSVNLDDEEEFVGKDEGMLSELTKEERAEIDKYFADVYDIEVGTWEGSGWFEPEGEFEKIIRES